MTTGQNKQQNMDVKTDVYASVTVNVVNGETLRVARTMKGNRSAVSFKRHDNG